MNIFELTGEGYLTDCNVRCRGCQPPIVNRAPGYIYIVLIGGLEHVLFFHSIGNFIIPTDEAIFFRGVETTNQYSEEYVNSSHKQMIFLGMSRVSDWMGDLILEEYVAIKNANAYGVLHMIQFLIYNYIYYIYINILSIYIYII